MLSSGALNADRCPVCRAEFTDTPHQNVELASLVDVYIANLRDGERAGELRQRLGLAINHRRQDRLEQLLTLHGGVRDGHVEIVDTDGQRISLLAACMPGRDETQQRISQCVGMTRAVLKAGIRVTPEDIYKACDAFAPMSYREDDIQAWAGAISCMLDAASGVAPDHVGPEGHTSLYLALVHADPGLCMKLINAGAPMDKDEGRSLLDLGYECVLEEYPVGRPEYLDLVKVMTSRGAVLLPDDKTMNKRLAEAIKANANGRVIELMLSLGADASATDGGLKHGGGRAASALEYIFTVPPSYDYDWRWYKNDRRLSETQSYARVLAALELVKAAPAGALKDCYVYHSASKLGGPYCQQWREVLKLLLDKGLSADASSDGPNTADVADTALGNAILFGGSAAVDMLLSRGVTVNRHINGQSYLGMALDNCCYDIARDLMVKGAVLVDGEQTLNQRLAAAVKAEVLDTVQWLLDLGATVDSPDSALEINGVPTRPLQYAIWKSNASNAASINIADITALLLGRGAAPAPVDYTAPASTRTALVLVPSGRPWSPSSWTRACSPQS